MPTTVGTVWVDVKFNVGDIARQLQAQLGAAAPGGGPGAAAATAMERTFSQSLTNIGKQAATVGRQMSMFLTLPMVALGKSATSTFNEFDQAMTQITALNAVPIEQTEKWRGQVRELGKEYGVAGEEAAKGLYFITSSGVDAADAMGVLDTASKAAAVGLGETKVVADVLTSALSAYGAANQSAAKTGDQLVAAVRYGKGEADELAGALSQVVPIAANVGVEFGEVAGAMAAMTLSGTSADQAATQLRGLFNTLQDMPPKSQKALKQYTGLDYAQVRMKLSAEGLIPTLKAIYDGFGEDKTAMAEVFDNIRALTGVFNLFGQNSEHTLEVVNKVTNATGDLNKAWEITAESKSKKLDIAMTSLHDTMIGLGADIVPAITPVVEVVGKLGEAFGALPAPLRGAAVAFGMLAAATGPVVWAFGQMMQGVGQLGTGLSALVTKVPPLAKAADALALRWNYLDGVLRSSRFGGGGPFGGLAAATASWAAALTLVAVAFEKIQDYQANVARMQDDLVKTAREGATGGLKEAEAEISKITGQLFDIDRQGKRFQQESQSWNPLTRIGSWFDTPDAMAAADAGQALIKAREEITKNMALSKQMVGQHGLDQQAAYKWLAEEAKAERVYKNSTDAMNAYITALNRHDPAAEAVAKSTLKATNALDGLIAAAKESSDAFFGLMDAEKRKADAERGLVDARQKVLDAEQAYRDSQQRTLDANAKIVDAQRKAVESTEALRAARLRLVEAEQALEDARRGPSEDERLNIESARLALTRAKFTAAGRDTSMLDRRQNRLDVRRARLDLARAEGAQAERIKTAEQEVADARQGVADAVQAEVEAQRAIKDATRAAADAKRDEAKAYKDIDAAKRGVADAERELYDSTTNLAIKQGELATAIQNSAESGKKFLEYLERLKAEQPAMAGIIDGYIAKFEALRRAQNPPPQTPGQGGVVDIPGEGQFVIIPGMPGAWVGRAAGGPLGAGQLSNVNERGMPELWSANGKQYLLPTDQGRVTPLKPTTIDVKGGDGVTIGDIYVQGVAQPTQTAYEVRRQLRAKGV